METLARVRIGRRPRCCLRRWPRTRAPTSSWTGTRGRMPSPPRSACCHRLHGRALAMMHVAMFEALNAIERRYKPYRLELVADRNTSREAAAAVAGHACWWRCIRIRRPALDALLARDARTASQKAPAKERGIILGRKAAADLLELRAEDGSERRRLPARHAGRVCMCPLPAGGRRRWAVSRRGS